MKKNKKIQDEEQYAILKSNGMSDEKACVIARNKEEIQQNAYHNYSYKELIVICPEKGISVVDKIKKGDLIDLIIKHEA